MKTLIIYLDREEVPDIENIESHVIRYLIEKAEAAAGRYDRLNRYYRGEHDSLRRRSGPDEVRVAVNYAKYVVDIAQGYYLGEAVKYNANQRHDKHDRAGGAAGVDSAAAGLPLKREIDIAPLIDSYDRQQISEIDGKIGKGMGIMGDCLELCYASTDADPFPRSAYIDPRNGILVCDSTVEHNKLFALVWEKRETTQRSKYYFCTVYTDLTERDYKCTDLKNMLFRQVGETRQHYFNAVPVIAYENNDQRQGDFEQIISLIDAYDDLMSNRLTDKKKFVDALLVFFGMTLAEGDEEKLVREKFIDGAPLDARAEYIQKTFDESAVQVLADALVREMHKMTLTVDMSDEQFAGNSSGQALKLKLLTMTLLVKNKIRCMEKGLKERFALYNNWLCVKGAMYAVNVTDIDVVFTISTPINETEIVNMVTQLQGVVDDETLLSQLWFVTDPAEAVENIKKQKQEAQQSYAASFGAAPQREEDYAQAAARTLTHAQQ